MVQPIRSLMLFKALPPARFSSDAMLRVALTDRCLGLSLKVLTLLLDPTLIRADGFLTQRTTLDWLFKYTVASPAAHDPTPLCSLVGSWDQWSVLRAVLEDRLKTSAVVRCVRALAFRGLAL